MRCGGALPPQPATHYPLSAAPPLPLQVMRSGGLLDLRSLPSQRHCELLLKLAEVSHPGLVRILMVYPIVYELLQDQKAGAARPQFTGVPPKKGKYRWAVRGSTCGQYGEGHVGSTGQYGELIR